MAHISGHFQMHSFQMKTSQEPPSKSRGTCVAVTSGDIAVAGMARIQDALNEDIGSIMVLIFSRCWCLSWTLNGYTRAHQKVHQKSQKNNYNHCTCSQVMSQLCVIKLELN